MYIELGLKSIRSLNREDYAKMAANPKYIKKVSDIRYGWKIDKMIKPNTKAENNI